jgi:hypothetical protein
MASDSETMAIFDELWDARLARVDAQLERIAGTAYWLGKQLAAHDITRDDVNRRLTALTEQRQYDDDAWVPWHLAEDTAADALRRGMGVRP